ncbi:MAG: division/cell wall cluster transcriptional repressor MraZ [Chloroflexota bacterium]|nr:division/cell wall cluster transcriptional repressor MraZ [Chloroflexota bacterium]
MFLGEYEYRIDKKGRVAIPAKLRKEFLDGLVITRGFDKCLLVYPKTEWDKFSARFEFSPITPNKNRRLNRLIFSGAFSAELDGQGRVALSPPLRQYAQIDDMVVITGSNRYLEIWSKELWEQEKLLMEEEAWQLAEGIELR